MKYRIYNKAISLFVGIALLFVSITPVFAANQINTIDIEAVLYEDGSMQVTQYWKGRFEEGTENYIPMNLPDYIKIHDLVVSDQNGAYETLSKWDVEWDFDQKSRKAGIHDTDNGIELCFGISQYAYNKYKISYKLDQVIGGYTDKDGVNFRFVNDGMNTTPTDVKIRISLADHTPITDEIADIWAFGYEGEIVFENGTIFASTTKALNPNNHVTILFSLDKGVIKPVRKELSAFDTIREEAFIGSDYDEDASFIEVLIAILFSVVFPIILVVWVIKRKKKKIAKQWKQFTDRFGYYRDLPNEGNISVSYALAKNFGLCEDGAVLATGMLRLIQLGCLSPIETQEVGFMGNTKEAISLRLHGCHHDQMNEFDEYFYTVLEGAAGFDAILQAKELERFASQNDTLLRAYIQKHEKAGKSFLQQKNCMKRWRVPSQLVDLTTAGEQELGELLGFKQYLLDFSLIPERNIKEIAIWKELLTYAMLFGIADQVAKQMKDLYPQITYELDHYSQTMTTAYSYHHLLYSNMIKAEQLKEQAARSSGSGGSASFGGGGGSIGGSSGGGSR